MSLMWTHGASLSACEAWIVVSHDGARYVTLGIDTPENAISLTGEDINALFALKARLQSPDQLCDTEIPKLTMN